VLYGIEQKEQRAKRTEMWPDEKWAFSRLKLVITMSIQVGKKYKKNTRNTEN